MAPMQNAQFLSTWLPDISGFGTFLIVCLATARPTLGALFLWADYSPILSINSHIPEITLSET
jgi:hypothetical protein